ncbi:cation:proton antiporter [Planctomonas psychrotolerans]|uniref:cation:proton antiporter n=1 Tax=Planctomonas psychrotolerans TaxID=2528712 RepID=UPI00123859F3|nr:cation:proton antiporter [Planctomonas psychrotolerans]
MDPFGTTAAVLAVAALVAFAANRARQPLIVAFILVGILVGPSFLGWVEDAGELDLLAEIGIAILLFLVGLKLDLHLVRSIGGVALITGLGQVVFTSLVGYGLALWFGMPAIEALYVAVALTFSSTIIIVKLLSDKRELEELHGRIALGFLIVQDVVVIIVMIALSSLGGERGGTGLDSVWVIVLGGTGLIVGMSAMMKWVLPRALELVATSQELLIVCSVAWAVSVAALTEWLGFSVEVGAFLAGFALASTRFRESIASSLTGLRDFLLLFFFIVLGSQLDFSAVGSQVPAAIAFSLFVLIGNPLIVLVIMGVMGYPKRVSFLAGLAVAQISEFSLILVALGRDLGHLDADTVGLVTLVGMITIGGSTYLILYSKQLFDLLSPVLGVFERRRPHDVPPPDGERFDVILFGNGRFGRRLIEQFTDAGHTVLVIDWDPYARLELRNAGLHSLVALRYGDADNPQFPETLPLASARWIVSTIADPDTNKVLAGSLRRHGATAPIAVTAHSGTAARQLAPEIERGAIDLILEPFGDASDDAITALRNL